MRAQGMVCCIWRFGLDVMMRDRDGDEDEGVEVTLFYVYGMMDNGDMS